MTMVDQKYDAEFMELVVREVIRRLMADGRLSLTGTAAVAAPRELQISERLVTLATLSGKLDGIARVVVPRRAVVTPAARDELKQRRIELQRGA